MFSGLSINTTVGVCSRSSTPHILLIQPVLTAENDVKQALSTEGFRVSSVNSVKQSKGIIADDNVNLILLDMDAMTELGPRILREFNGLDCVIIVNEHQAAIAAEAMCAGAIDYIVKPFCPQQLLDAVRGALRLRQAIPNLIAVSPMSLQVLQLARRAAKTSATILIGGESGTGKERLARYIHEMSARAEKPFLAINCAAIPEAMLESILFGHNKGAFTGAVSAQPGKFELAQGGTLLLDEISELPLNLQAKLLRVLQEKEVERLGSNQTIALDVRIIAASNKDLRKLVADGLFREDLFYRLDVLPMNWPALRERPDDIIPLANYFIERYASQRGYRLSERACQLLLSYEWPGNVRELDNVIQRSLIMARGLHIQAVDLMLPHCAAEPEMVESGGWHVPEGLSETRRHAEFQFVLETLRRFRGHRTRTADALGMTTRALRYKLAAMREQGIDIEQQIQAEG
ncbi:lateral flagellar response regulator transcription factor LafK [Aeromonas veronii]|uniref:lateral flagellar response regulator transcription factor LafK n=1 Tax=Aeromonas TaxID=642 RepID=UPI00067E5936|nr:MULTISPECIES: lateral flagellar response regulator transcription factor LafK [Aeromonas]HDN9001570.1 lateral flagellar response regulator transcription factor LafK [Aeromonas veronii AMC24]KRV64993.1 AAA family ATPase [Aeromonas veronii]KRV72200.1 AAA family ATPase [Aeromonas veronii]KRV85301.1 AAA family ATPase [Aeromonas veronii]KRV85837.1 AAA family ATPase [Aeromonas veronii]